MGVGDNFLETQKGKRPDTQFVEEIDSDANVHQNLINAAKPADMVKVNNAAMQDQYKVVWNLAITAFLTLLTVISITNANTHVGMSLFLGVLSAYVAFTATTLQTKNIWRFIAYGFKNNKGVNLVFVSFIMSAGIAYINVYEALKVLGYVETNWFN